MSFSPPVDQEKFAIFTEDMRKIIVTEFMFLDSVEEAPGGNETAQPHRDWENEFDAQEIGKYNVDELAGVDSRLWVKLHTKYSLHTGPDRPTGVSPAASTCS